MFPASSGSTACLEDNLKDSREKEKENHSIEVSDGNYEDNFRVYLDLKESPQNLSSARKWLAVIAISSAAACVTCASSVAAFTEEGVAKDFHVSHEVTILSISFFVLGLGLGPLLIGPLSELHGRNIVYRCSYVMFFLLSWVVSFAPNISVYLIFRFITGFCGSAFLSVAGGSISDLFVDEHVGNPMAFYTICPFIGPVIGPLISGFVNQNLNWRWAYHIMNIWIFVELVALAIVVPETYVPVLTMWKAIKLRRDTGDSRYWAMSEKDAASTTLFKAILVSCYTPFELMIFDRMALPLDVWTSIILGILYVAFEAFPLIFQGVHGFNIQSTGMTFLGIGMGMIIAVSTQPLWNRLYRWKAQKHDGQLPPESRLYMGEVGGILVPIGLFWIAFTSYHGVPWIIPIIASIPFGTGIIFVFTSTFTYLITAYRPIAASALAANCAMRFTFAAAFPLFAGAMYDKMGIVGATAMLAGLTTIMAPLPFIFHHFGPHIRKRSRFAVS